MHKLITSLISLLIILKYTNCQLTYRLIGGVTESSFTIKAKSSDGAAVNLYLNSTLQGTYNADSQNYYTITLANLTSSTVYNINIVHNSIQNVFSVKTFPKPTEKVTTLNFIASSTSYTDTKSFIYDRIYNSTPNFFMMLGNIHNSFVDSSSWKDYEAAYLKVLTSDYTSNLYKNTPLVYLYDEYDFAPTWGKANTNNPNLQTVNDVYRQMFPNYSLPSKGIYQSFRYGNVLFLMLDSRTFLNANTNSFLGSTQVNWAVSQLQAASSDPNIGAVFICLTQVWNYVASSYDWDIIKQNFDSVLASASDDKRSIGDTMTKNFNFNRPTMPNFKSVMMIVGEKTTAFDDGSWNNFGNFPIAVCGPIDYWQQCRGGPYSHGSFHDNPNNFCTFRVYQSGSNTCIYSQGTIATNKKNRVDQMVWNYDTCKPVEMRGRINLKCPILYTEKLVNAAITIGAVSFVYVIFFVIIYKAAMSTLNYSKVKDD